MHTCSCKDIFALSSKCALCNDNFTFEAANTGIDFADTKIKSNR